MFLAIVGGLRGRKEVLVFRQRMQRPKYDTKLTH